MVGALLTADRQLVGLDDDDEGDEAPAPMTFSCTRVPIRCGDYSQSGI